MAASFNGNVDRFFVLRPRDVQHPTFPVYHVPREPVLAPLANPGVDRHIQLRNVRGPFRFDDLSELLFFLVGEKPNAIIVLAAMSNRTRRI